ncbi:MAG: cytidine deaminase [Candidatus Muiribacterium halophilum]|uniref:Cytidine deaminase n=1 Tax=Muiribacterium halophilum TaxID=2053465 RepID=A0A2N5ZHE5_MUIH1|nr:MAG: cytidine deaminase [Candidatus Muirbacterium halophilum]
MIDLKLDSIDNELIEKAREVRRMSYSPYSGFAVGAAVYDEKLGFFTGTNVENSSYGMTVCAERIAVFKAISEGAKDIRKIAIIADDVSFVSPCGACRQVIFEFGDEIEVIMTNLKGDIKKTYIKDLLPFGFRLKK